MKFVPHEYQEYAINRLMELPEAGLFLDMGLGKTVTTLTAIRKLMYEEFAVSRVLVIAPKRVAEDTWTTECSKWDHLAGLTISQVLGPRAKRQAALKADADIYVINRENVPWLVQELRRSWPFDMVVVDELSSFKSSTSQRFRALRQVRPLIRRFVGLTGTPAPNGLLDLWPQMYLIDRGERLGKTITGYRQRYFNPGKTNGHVVYSYELKKGAQASIEKLISDICISMKAEDYLTMPEFVVNDIRVTLSPEELKLYRTMEEEQLLELDGEEATALSAASVYNKLLQMANGGVYTDTGAVAEIHRKKVEALEDIVEASQGQPVLVFYAYKHDLARLKEAFPEARTLDRPEDIHEWNAGRIRMLLAQPASMGHGLNLQAGGHIIVWYGLTWSLEMYEQANARLYRQGQQHGVIVHRIIAAKTIDEQVVRRLAKKAGTQDSLMEALKAWKQERLNSDIRTDT